MKAFLRFDLPQESHQHLCALYGSQLLGIVEDVCQFARSRSKHADLDESATVAYLEVSERLHELMLDLPPELLG